MHSLLETTIAELQQSTDTSFAAITNKRLGFVHRFSANVSLAHSSQTYHRCELAYGFTR